MTWRGTTDSPTGIFRIQTCTTRLTLTYTLNVCYRPAALGAYYPLNHPLPGLIMPTFLRRTQKLSRSKQVAPEITGLISDRSRLLNFGTRALGLLFIFDISIIFLLCQ